MTIGAIGTGFGDGQIGCTGSALPWAAFPMNHPGIYACVPSPAMKTQPDKNRDMLNISLNDYFLLLVTFFY